MRKTFCDKCGKEITTDVEWVFNHELCSKCAEAVDIFITHPSGPSTVDVQPVGRWISVNDRLPEESVSVLICTNKGIRSVSARYGNRFFITIVEAFTEDTVTHWQPLPELPKDGNTE